MSLKNHVSLYALCFLDILVKFGHIEISVSFLRTGVETVLAMQSITNTFLRESSIKPDFIAGEPFTDDEADPGLSDEREYILCARCRRVITTSSDRIDVNGAHVHTFANPHGIVFEIGCFQTAMGCAYQGPVTNDFSWFKGYSWKIACCGTCMTHLGWLFVSIGESGFHGLILDRLVESRQK